MNKSYLQWAGGKGKALHKLLPILNGYKKDTFVEPFIGAANVSLNIDAKSYIWNDLNTDLVHSHKTLLSSEPSALNDYLHWCETYFEYGFEYYYTLRDYFNRHNEHNTPIQKAALFQYLNKHGFNGLCRYNQKGIYNVPRGTVTVNPKNVPEESIKLFIDRFLGKTTVFNTSFEETFKYADSLEDCLIYCFTEGAEILTDSGWKEVKDITLSDSCLSRELNTKNIDWVKVQNVHERFYNGDVYRYKGKSLDIEVTSDHNLYLSKRHSGEEYKVSAKDAVGKKLEWICGGGVWVGDSSPTFNLVGKKVDKKSFAYLLGIFVTDGSVNNQGSILISQSKKRVIDKIRKSIQACNLVFSEYDNTKGIKTFYLSRKYLPFFSGFYLKEHRKIPKEFMESDTETLSALLEGIVDGDGDNASSREHIRISIGSKSLVDNIGEIAVKLGLSSNFYVRQPKESYLRSEDRIIKGKKVWYNVSINKTKTRVKRKENEEIAPFSGTVNCITLEKWHNVLMRRNGKMVWIGQCDPPYIPAGESDFNYTAEGFGIEEQKKLVECAKNSKHTTIISNHWNEITKELYKDADEIHTFPVQRTISCKGNDRKQVEECVVVFKK